MFDGKSADDDNLAILRCQDGEQGYRPRPLAIDVHERTMTARANGYRDC